MMETPSLFTSQQLERFSTSPRHLYISVVLDMILEMASVAGIIFTTIICLSIIPPLKVTSILLKPH